MEPHTDHAQATRVPEHLWQQAVARIVPSVKGDPQLARRFVHAAPTFGIDLSLMWATPPSPSSSNPISTSHADQLWTPQQGCLVVVGEGNTAVLFVSPELPTGEPTDLGIDQRAACITAACDWLTTNHKLTPHGVAQALLDEDEDHARRALAQAGFDQLGDLLYLRAPLPARRIDQPWPAGVTVVPASKLDPADADQAVIDALERTYEGTLDCPELCGLRDGHDVLASHKSVGQHDPCLWFLLYDPANESAGPQGCILLSPSPEQGTVELVYLGLAPPLRGKGLAAPLLGTAMARAGGRPTEREIACAVDARNIPAIKLYQRAGFTHFARKTPMIRAISSH